MIDILPFIRFFFVCCDCYSVHIDEQASHLMTGLDWKSAGLDLQGAVDYLKKVRNYKIRELISNILICTPLTHSLTHLLLIHCNQCYFLSIFRVDLKELE
jgi:hypothetical protein